MFICTFTDHVDPDSVFRENPCDGTPTFHTVPIWRLRPTAGRTDGNEWDHKPHQGYEHLVGMPGIGRQHQWVLRGGCFSAVHSLRLTHPAKLILGHFYKWGLEAARYPGMPSTREGTEWNYSQNGNQLLCFPSLITK